MKTNPSVSIIIPLYNKEQIINHTVQSVLHQTGIDLELIIVDDGSTDGSVNVVKGIRDNRLQLIRQKNGGPGKARNAGLAYAKGDWILFLDADDELTDGSLRHLLDMAEHHSEANIIDGSFIIRSVDKKRMVIYDDNHVIRNNYKAFFFQETLPSTGHTLFKAELIKKYPYNTTIRRYEDVELIMRILKEARIVTTSRPIFYVNSSFSSASSARKTIKEDYIGHLDFKGKNFWEKMTIYQFYLWERDYYPEEVNKLYPTLRWRYDMLILNKTLHFLKKQHVL